MKRRLAIISSHPIQYNAPLFRSLSAHTNLDLRVFYGWKGATEVVHDPGFGCDFSWDTPLLDGYEYEFVENVAKQPGSHHFRGIDLPKLNQRIERWGADVVLVYGWSFRAHLKALRHFKGKIPVLFRGDSTLIDGSTRLRKFARRLWLRWVYRHIDVALAVGTNNADYFRYHGVLSENIRLVPHAVDNEFFSSQEDKRSDLALQQRRRLGLDDETIVFLFVGKFEPKKAPELLIEAFKRLAHANVCLLMVGAGPLEPEMRTLANSRTFFLGFKNQSEMPIVYRLADVVVLPSRGPNETWGLALNEAMACGRPIIASTRVGAARDLVLPEKTGWLVEADSVMSLYEAMDIATELGRKKLSILGQRAGEFIRSFSIEAQVNAIFKLLGGGVYREAN